MNNLEQEAVLIIKPDHGWKSIDLKELYRYKDLFWFLTVRGIKAKYAQSILGVSWAIIQPLITTVIFTIVFGRLAKVNSDGVPYAVFSFIALLPWTYFSNTLTDSSNALVQNASMITKVYFPRIILPLSVALSRLLDFLIGVLVLIGLLLYYQIQPSIWVVLTPLLLIILLLTSLGSGMFLSAMSIQYRDVKHAMTFFVQLLIYAAPVVYSTNEIPEKWRFWYALNPMVGVIEGFRAILLNKELPWIWIAEGSLVALLIFLMGAFYFRKMEKVFADVA
jgi:lipopolysaccharide transport system permease protein